MVFIFEADRLKEEGKEAKNWEARKNSPDLFLSKDLNTNFKERTPTN